MIAMKNHSPSHLRERYNQQIKAAKILLFAVAVATLLNSVVFALELKYIYYIYTAIIPYHFVFLGYYWTGYLPEEFYFDLEKAPEYGYLVLAAYVAVAVITTAVYFLLFAKVGKRLGWTIAALIWHLADCGFLAWTLISDDITADKIPNAVLHIAAVGLFIAATVAHAKLRKLPEDTEAEGEELPPPPKGTVYFRPPKGKTYGRPVPNEKE